MSRIEETAISAGPARPATEPPTPALSRRGPWAWAIIACLTLGASGAVRAVQERRHKDEMDYKETCPFSLPTLTTKLGGWRLIEGGEKSLDDLTIRITGGTDYILRNYVDDLTGVSLVALILFGPAEPVLPHTPEVCYPSTGYSLADDASDRLIKADDGMGAEFRSAVYARPGGRAMMREEVYYSFRLEGRWSPDVGAGRKFPRRNPGIFKVQVQRRVAEGERRDRDEPIEQFLKILVAEIERRVAAGASPAGPTTSAAAKASTSGLGSAPVVDESGLGLVPRRQGLSARRTDARSRREPRRLAGQDRRPADQADDRDHRQQVEGE